MFCIRRARKEFSLIMAGSTELVRAWRRPMWPQALLMNCLIKYGYVICPVSYSVY